MVSRTACCRRLHTFKPKTGKIKLIDKYIDYPNLVVFVHIIVQ